jgi:antitoxin component YwqK of YwqJK toxin-antitoxin module
MYKLLFSAIIVMLSISSIAQQPIDTINLNQTDKMGKKQGYWKVKYETGSIKYTAFFKDNKPVGEMRRYFEDNTIKAILRFDASGVKTFAKLYYQSGPLAAEGTYVNSFKDSTWKYYSYYTQKHTRSETYNLGKLNGKVLSFYNNGNIAEEVSWKNGIKEGSWKKYYEDGTIMMYTVFSDNKRTGAFIFNYPDGKPEWNGKYINDKMEGKWVHFKPNGEVETSIEYVNGIAANEKEFNETQNKILQELELKRGQIPEPDETNFLGPRQP